MRARPNVIIEDHGEWLEVDISTPSHPDAVMKIDKADWNDLCGIKRGRVYAWQGRTHRSPYAIFPVKNGRHQTITLVHRFILKGGVKTDHKDRNGLNNRRCNLRNCSQSDNGCNRGPQRNNNSTGVKGVYPHRSGRFYARITKDGRTRHLGTFDTVEDAEGAYRLAARELHGEYCYG